MKQNPLDSEHFTVGQEVCWQIRDKTTFVAEVIGVQKLNDETTLYTLRRKPLDEEPVAVDHDYDDYLYETLDDPKFRPPSQPDSVPKWYRDGHERDMKQANDTIDHLNAAIGELCEAIRLTVEYVGTDILYPGEGWSWFDALKKYRPDIAEHFVAWHNRHQTAQILSKARTISGFDDAKLQADLLILNEAKLRPETIENLRRHPDMGTTHRTLVIPEGEGTKLITVLHNDGAATVIRIKPHHDGVELHIELGHGKRLHDLVIHRNGADVSTDG